MNNAGTNIRKKAVEYDYDEYLHIRETNMDSVFELSRLAHPLLAVWPGAAIMIAVLGFNLFGDGLRDRYDPRLERR